MPKNSEYYSVSKYYKQCNNVKQSVIETDWYVAYTNVQAEKRAAEALSRGGFKTFLPMHLRIAKRRRGRVWIERPLFPRYLFVGFDPGCSWGYLHEVKYVNGMIGAKGVAVKVSAATVDQLRAIVSAREFDEKPIIPITAGAGVRFISGPFEGFVGICGSMSSEKRVEILLELLKREVSVNVSVNHLSVIL